MQKVGERPGVGDLGLPRVNTYVAVALQQVIDAEPAGVARASGHLTEFPFWLLSLLNGI